MARKYIRRELSSSMIPYPRAAFSAAVLLSEVYCIFVITSKHTHILHILDPLYYDMQFCLAARGCNHGDLRLVGGPVNSEGRVEICIGGVWGRVCHSYFPWNNNAQVVCRQLGLPMGVSGSGKCHLRMKSVHFIYSTFT